MYYLLYVKMLIFQYHVRDPGGKKKPSLHFCFTERPPAWHCSCGFLQGHCHHFAPHSSFVEWLTGSMGTGPWDCWHRKRCVFVFDNNLYTSIGISKCRKCHLPSLPQKKEISPSDTVPAESSCSYSVFQSNHPISNHPISNPPIRVPAAQMSWRHSKHCSKYRARSRRHISRFNSKASNALPAAKRNEPKLRPGKLCSFHRVEVFP